MSKWLVSAPPDAMAFQTIRPAEQDERRASFTTQNVSYDAVRPFVIEQYGCLGEAASSLLMHPVADNAKAKSLAGHVPIAQAQWRAMRETRETSHAPYYGALGLH